MDDRKEALRLLRTFEQAVCAHPVLSSRLVRGESDYLQRFRGQLFVSLREFVKGKTAADGVLRGIGAMSVGIVLGGLGVALVSLAAWLSALLRRPGAVVFGIDKVSSKGKRDFRIEGIYAHLDRQGTRYAEVLHAVVSRETFRQLRSRGHATVYQEALDFLHAVLYRRCRCRVEAARIAAGFEVPGASPEEQAFFRALAERCLWNVSLSRFRERFYRLFLRAVGARIVLSIDDTRNYHDLMAAARSLGIASYAFQHGHFTKNHVGWLAHACPGGHDARPDALFVWSPYWKRELLRLGTNFKEDEIRIGGNPKGKDVVAPVKRVPSADGRLRVLVSYEKGAPKKEIAPYLERLKRPEIRLSFSARPDFPLRKQLEEYGLKESQVEVVRDLKAALPSIDIAVGAYSTLLYDLIAMGVPVATLDVPFDFGDGLEVSDLAERLTLDGDLPARLRAAAERGAAEAERRRLRYVEGEGDIEATLTSLLESRLRGRRSSS